MNNFKTIETKLEQFITRYYTNELFKGMIMFFAIGLLYFLITLLIEYVLWLSSMARTVLFWLFISVELGLFIRFIIWPLSKLFKLQKGINYEDASRIIGKHFPEVNDKLLNVLQLHNDAEQSELLLASIDQKAAELQPVPFKLAVDFRKNLNYLKYAAIPVVIIVLTLLTGHFKWFSDSYERVINYKIAYEPPAPFQFFVVNDKLEALENEDFRLIIKTVGNVVPENAQIHYAGETYFLRQTDPGAFEFVFPKFKSDVSFTLFGNQVRSKIYDIKLVQVPTLINLEMRLDYPKHTGIQDEVLKGTGNATVPEGTQVTWKIQARSTDDVMMYAHDSLPFQLRDDGRFEMSKTVVSKLNYSIATSNSKLKDYENLDYNIEVIKDRHPELHIKMERDSIDNQSLYFLGQASDDYGLTKVQLVYYPIDNQSDKIQKSLVISHSNFEEFVTAFPNQLELTGGVTYELYFEVFDNDILHGFKSAKSSVFTYRKLSVDEVEQKHLREQAQTIEKLDKSFEKMKHQDTMLEELSRLQKEKEQLNYNDKQKLENFIKRQKQQEEIMQNFNKRLQENLEDFQKENSDDFFKNELKDRLKDHERQLRQDEKLLKELETLQDKIQKEELVGKLDELAKQNKNKQKSLQQLLELTKRYYVAKKTEKLQKTLEKLANEQDQLSKNDGDKNTKQAQDQLISEFKNFRRDLEQLRKDNAELNKPLDIPQDKSLEQDIQKSQNEAASDLLKKENAEENNRQSEGEESLKDAQKRQEDAAKKMKQMSSEMSQSMMSGGQEQLQEDAGMLRQILDNLLLFSFEQEDLMDKFKSIQINHNQYGNYLINQSNLKAHFGHIEDSLFALSLRQPKLSEHVNSKITDVFFYMDKSMEQLSENLLYQGVASQQYAITSTNDLASFLSDILDHMESDLNPGAGKGSGKGKGQSGGGGGQQLPDIIMSQEELNKQMQEGLKKGDLSAPHGKEGDKGTSGKPAGEDEGKDGDQEGDGGQDGDSENMNGELYRIYQEQQRLRQALEERLEDLGNPDMGRKVLKDMERIESDLINNGFTNRTLQRMMALQHQLLKLEEATFMQGRDSKRESETNREKFENTSIDQIPTAKEYFNTTEILNRQALPLQKVYKMKVQEYFKKNDDQL